MGLNSLEKNVFIFLERFHFYLWCFPIQWDTKYQQIYFANPKFKYWNPPILALAYTFGYGLSGALTALYISFYYVVDRIEVMVLMIVFFTLVIPVLVFTVISLHTKLFILAFNEILLMAVRIEKGKI